MPILKPSLLYKYFDKLNQLSKSVRYLILQLLSSEICFFLFFVSLIQIMTSRFQVSLDGSRLDLSLSLNRPLNPKNKR